MSNAIMHARAVAARRQQFRCYYCSLPMWDSRPEDFMARHGLTRRQAMQLQCTAEHLVARCDGGSNAPSNIVAACAFCNQKRHARLQPLDPVNYKALVKRRISSGHWLQRMLSNMKKLRCSVGNAGDASDQGACKSIAVRRDFAVDVAAAAAPAAGRRCSIPRSRAPARRTGATPRKT